MSTFAILATGQSLTQEDVEYVRGKCRVIAVSNAYTLAPWADALVSNDARWWKAHPEAFEFAGRRFCYEWVDRRVERIKGRHNFRYGINSGLRGALIANDLFRATRILLLGFDMHGTHYFGPHTHAKLKNTDANRFAIHIKQFDHWDGCEVTNCTPNSALQKFPIKDLREVLHS